MDGGVLEVNGQDFTWGAFVNQLITFVLTAAVIYFVVVLPMKALFERRERGEQTGPVLPTQTELLVEIRDLLQAQHGQPPASGPEARHRA